MGLGKDLTVTSLRIIVFIGKSSPFMALIPVSEMLQFTQMGAELLYFEEKEGRRRKRSNLLSHNPHRWGKNTSKNVCSVIALH